MKSDISTPTRLKRTMKLNVKENYFSETDTSEPISKTTRTFKHGARFSRKLQKRLTRRTLAEARALKEQGTECMHVLLYLVELVGEYKK